MSFRTTVVSTKPPLQLWLVLSPEAIVRSSEAQVLSLEDSDRPWLPLKESPGDAADRTTWYGHVPKERMMFLRIIISPIGVGHFVREGMLTYNATHAAWRWHGDMPFKIADDAGHVLLEVDPNVHVFSQ